MNLRFVTYLVAVVAIAIGAGELASAVVSAVYGDPDLIPMIISGVICLAIGTPAFIWSRAARRSYIGIRDGFLGVVASWVVAAVLGAIPFVMTGVFGPLDALFESMSGFTTTGASVLTDYDQPHGIMFWRSLTHWYGGMGIVVLFLALLPAVGGGAIRLFAAEAPGPSTERLTPRLRDTAMRLWLIYLGLTVLEVIMLIVVGLGPFSALTHTFGTVATGGFSPEAASIGAYNSVGVEVVIVVFMVLAGGNFALYYSAVSGRQRAIWKDPEWRLFIGILVMAVIAVAVSLVVAKSHFSFGHAFRESVFQVVSLQTTTGYVTADFDQWNSFAKTLLLMLMFVGGCAGSTAGGIKVVRFMILAKNARRAVAQAVHPRAVTPIKVGRRVVSNEIVTAVLGFFFLWVTVFVIGTLLLAADNMSMVTSASAVAATLNNIGPGLELVGATLNYAPIAGLGKGVLIVMMLLGRLELMAVMVPFTRSFWKR